MSRVAYDRPFSAVGFRPYRQTTPFAAAQGLAGLGYLGDDSATLAQWGFTPAQVAQIIDAHNSGALSDTGYQFALQGGVPVSDLASFLEQDPGASAEAAAVAAGGSAPAAGVPNGATLVYKASIDVHLFATGGATSKQDFLTHLAGALQADGIQVVGQSTSNSGFSVFDIQLQLLITGAGYGKAQDVQAVIDHAIYVQRGEMPISSSISVTGVPGSAGSGGVALPATSLTSFLEQNAMWIGLGVVAILVLPKVLK